MPPKSDPETETKPQQKKGNVICGLRSPGPKYELKTLVGYKEHCLSRYRNPAYTFGLRQPGFGVCDGPGPKYVLPDPKRGGFTFGIAGKTFDTSCGPGPKYVLPVPKTPAFSIKFRTKYRKGCGTPGPYYIKSSPQGPFFTMGIRTPGLKCDGVPGSRLYSVHLVKPRAPSYSMGAKLEGKLICHSPGPKYHPKPAKPTPIYSFGVKHSECAPPYITECDEQC